MSDKLKKTIIGAVVAVATAAAVSYGLISQQTADKIQEQTNQTLSNDQQASSSSDTEQQAPDGKGPDARPLAPTQPDTASEPRR